MWKYYVDEYNEIELHKAIRDRKTLQEIFNLANTPLVNQRNRNGETPFMLAVKQSNSLVVNAIGQ